MTFAAAAEAAALPFCPGIQALAARDRGYINFDSDARATGSCNVDEHFAGSEPNAPRWDYVVGCKTRIDVAIWIEAHPASSSGNVDDVIRKF